MKGAILAGGLGTRLSPLTEITNKHLLPVGKEPMIWHPVRQLKLAEIRDILVVTSVAHMGDVVSSLGSGARFDCEFTYRVQDSAGGIAHALALAEDFCADCRVIVLLGDNIFERSIAPHVEAFARQAGARVLLKEVGDPERYGVAALDEMHVVAIEEKPDNPRGSFAVVGCYMYDPRVWRIIREAKPSERGELEITGVNNEFVRRGQLEYGLVQGRWTDAGTFESLSQANEILLANDNEVLV